MRASLGAPALVGAAAGVAAVAAGVATGATTPGETAFALGALVCGFGTAAWGGARLFGPNVDRFTHRGDAAGTAEAMARLAAAGAGGMAGAAVASILFGIG